MRWLKESNTMVEGVECDGRRRQIRWLKESNEASEGDESDGYRRRDHVPRIDFTRYPTEIIPSRL